MNVAAEDEMTGSGQRKSLRIVNFGMHLFNVIQVQVLKSYSCICHRIVDKNVFAKRLRDMWIVPHLL